HPARCGDRLRAAAPGGDLPGDRAAGPGDRGRRRPGGGPRRRPAGMHRAGGRPAAVTATGGATPPPGWRGGADSAKVSQAAPGFRSRWPCGRSAAGSASPCQGEGRGFEPRRPLGARPPRLPRPQTSVGWPRGEATACKAVYAGSNPVPTSTFSIRAVGAAGARFLDTEEVTGSIPVPPTTRAVRVNCVTRAAAAGAAGTAGDHLTRIRDRARRWTTCYPQPAGRWWLRRTTGPWITTVPAAMRGPAHRGRARPGVRPRAARPVPPTGPPPPAPPPPATGGTASATPGTLPRRRCCSRPPAGPSVQTGRHGRAPAGPGRRHPAPG